MTQKKLTLIICALAAVGLLRTAYFHFVSEPLHEPVRPRIDERYAALRAMLPRSGEVGYVSDLPAAVHLGEDAGSLGTRLFLHAQYALAPLILRYDDDRPALVVANLADPARLPEILQRHRLLLVAEAGPGLAILRPQ